jgi:predicted DNA repair protein MutK
VVLRILFALHLVQLESRQDSDDDSKANRSYNRALSVESATHTSNLTLPNVFLVLMGPMTEHALCNRVLVFQGVCSLLAFAIRYGLVQFAYPS